MKNFSAIFNHPTSIQQQPERKGKENPEPDEEDERRTSEDRARCDWDINLAAVVVSSSDAGAGSSDTLGVIEFDPSGSVIATGGIARKIRIYNLTALLPNEVFPGNFSLLDHLRASEYCICTPAKLSSLRWRPSAGGRVLGSGDYDGVITEYDMEKKLPVFERDEHGGRRVWSLDYSCSDPFLGASGSDDGTVQMWDPRGECVATVQPAVARSAVCCVEFCPSGGPFLAVGCADRKAYGYDVRKMADPVLILDGHGRTVTYVRFLDNRTIVTASTDGCLKLWDIVDESVIRTYSGHVNCRSFVGLSVWRNGGLIGCGSESNQVFVYDKRWGEPIWVHEVEPVVGSGSGSEKGWVSSVCWRQTGEEQCTLLAGGSDGALQIFSGKRRSPV